MSERMRVINQTGQMLNISDRIAVPVREYELAPGQELAADFRVRHVWWLGVNFVSLKVVTITDNTAPGVSGQIHDIFGSGPHTYTIMPDDNQPGGFDVRSTAAE